MAVLTISTLYKMHPVKHLVQVWTICLPPSFHRVGSSIQSGNQVLDLTNYVA